VERTGTNVPTIRYYESIALLARAPRQEGGHRLYSEKDVEQLTFIRRCRDFGFSVEQVRSLVASGEIARARVSTTSRRHTSTKFMNGFENWKGSPQPTGRPARWMCVWRVNSP
jgi:DNA-binding transcriptional MerR regulator